MNALRSLPNRLTAPALRRILRRKNLKDIRRDRAADDTQTPQVAAEEQGQPFARNYISTADDTEAGAIPDLEFSTRIFQATGARAANFQEILQVPRRLSQRRGKGQRLKNVAGARTKENETQSQERRKHSLPGLPDRPQPGRMITRRAMGSTPPPPLAQMNPQREPSDAALDLKRQGLEIQQQRLQALADRVAAVWLRQAERQNWRS